MKYIIPLFLLSVLLSCDKEETGQLIGSFWRYEHTYTQEYEIGLDGTIRFPGSIYKDSDTVTTVTFNYQHQISFLTKDRVRFNNNRKVSTNQITDVSSETYDFYNYNSKSKKGAFQYSDFYIIEDTLVVLSKYPESIIKYINVSNVKIK